MGIVLEGEDEGTLHMTLGKSTFDLQIRHFDGGAGRESGVEVEALLSYWLSLFVLPREPEGRELALAPMYLSSLYTKLEECINIVAPFYPKV